MKTVTKLNSLKSEALKSAKLGGHMMKTFTVNDNLDTGYTDCKNCGKYAQVLVYPSPNQINIDGDAISTSCDTKRINIPLTCEDLNMIWDALYGRRSQEMKCGGGRNSADGQQILTKFDNLMSRIQKANPKF